MTEVCARCKQPLRWVRTERGKRMPLNPDPVPDGNVAIVDGVVVVLAPAVLSRMRAEGLDKLELYKSHFATCPYAGEFRRPRS